MRMRAGASVISPGLGPNRLSTLSMREAEHEAVSLFHVRAMS
ncbi:hypothetical protein [Lichenifustis flavocetrariae]|nr:hypothetical protein [Lichenifustis flavocetrariae]